MIGEKDLPLIEEIATLYCIPVQDATEYYKEMIRKIKEDIKVSNINIVKGMDRRTLEYMCKHLTDIETEILIMYYCDRKSLTAIAYEVNYSYDYVEEMKARAIKKIKSSQ